MREGGRGPSPLRAEKTWEVEYLAPWTFWERETIISHLLRGRTGLTGGSIGSAFIRKGVFELPRPLDDESVAGVRLPDRGVAKPGVNGVEDEGGPIDIFLLMGVICH